VTAGLLVYPDAMGRRMRGGRPLAVAVAIAALLTGCTADTADEPAAAPTASAEPPSFLSVPDPLPDGEPGDILRSEPMPGAPEGTLAWRVLYHSTDAAGDDILVSGIVVAPTSEPPPGGRPVVSWAHPTTGTAARCAPSLGIEAFASIAGLGSLLDAGCVVAATDYPGMGAAGPASFLVGASEGHSVLDAARAAGGIPEARASDDVLLWGHSQGGHAALFAGELAADYAPELALRGVAVAAPATDLEALLDATTDDASGLPLSSFALGAYASTYADRLPETGLGAILTPAGVAATPRMNELCLLGDGAELQQLAAPLVGAYLSADPSEVEPWATLLDENTPGSVALVAPLLIAQGDSDGLVSPATSRAFADRACDDGTAVTYLELPGSGHGEAAFAAVDSLVPWFAGALRGEAAGCRLSRG
jgi:pimeloyl-ACP methyl ester carboxylesterase